MKIYLRALLLVCMVLFALPALAADAPEAGSAADNACYAGGSLAGKCDFPTEAETEWAWTCGWYIARAEHGVIAPAAVPAWCGYNAAISVAGCIASSDPTVGDFRLVGPLNTVNNGETYYSSGAQCADVSFVFTVVDAPSAVDAEDACDALLGTGYIPYALVLLGYPVSATWYWCALPV